MTRHRTVAVLAALALVGSVCRVANGAVVAAIISSAPTPEAVAADPSLAHARVFDLMVTQGGGDHFSSAELRLLGGEVKFYVPPRFDSDTSQKTFWTLFPNLEDDTFVTTPGYLNTSDPAHLTILGGSTFPDPSHYSYPAIMPNAGNSQDMLDISWADFNAGSESLGDGTYLLARLTAETRGAFTVAGGVRGTQNPTTLVPFTLVAIDCPEPDSGTELDIGWILMLHASGWFREPAGASRRDPAAPRV